MSARARVRRGVALACIVLAVLLLGIELVLRLAGYEPLADTLVGKGRILRPSANADLVYELTPRARGAGWGTWVEVNAHGFRDREIALEKGERRRIVCLGDSITFGNHLALEETYPEVLERQLAARGDAVDVLNLGVGGYDTLQEVAFLEATGLAFRPDLVVVGWCVNDVGIVSVPADHAFTAADGEKLVYRSRIAQLVGSILGTRALRRELYERNREQAYARAYAHQIAPLDGLPGLAAPLAALRAALEGAPPSDRELASRRIPARWYASENRLGRVRFAFERLGALAQEHGFRVVVLLIPYLEEDPLIERGYELVRVLAEASGFAVLDPSAEFRARGLADLRLLPEDPVHPDAEGHAILARTLEQEFLPGRSEPID